MSFALSLNETTEWPSEAERKEGDAVFVIGTLPGWKRTELNGRLAAFRAEPDTAIESWIAHYARITPEVLKAGLRGWSGMRDQKGVVAEFFKRDDGSPRPIDEAVAMIDGDTSVSLALAIMRFNSPGATTLGN